MIFRVFASLPSSGAGLLLDLAYGAVVFSLLAFGGAVLCCFIIISIWSYWCNQSLVAVVCDGGISLWW